jgi:tetratricopeptide (TPR) repeat protein
MDHLTDLLDVEDASDRAIDDAIRHVEDQLLRGLQRYPRDEYLLTAEAEFSRMLNDHERSFDALKKAFEANPRDPFIASRLARLYEEREELSEAERTLHAALEGNPGDKQLNYRYGTVLRLLDVTDPSRLVYYFRRAFTEGDQNYEAQFWFARYAFELPDEKNREESRRLFRQLRTVGMPHQKRIEIRDRIVENGRPAVFRGSVVKLEDEHGFIERDGSGDHIFMHCNNTTPEAWSKLRRRDRVAFEIGFTFSGVTALMVEAA